jgi:hypothetical protein
LLPEAVLLVFEYSSVFAFSVNVEELVTDDQSLLRISIAFLAWFATLR